MFERWRRKSIGATLGFDRRTFAELVAGYPDLLAVVHDDRIVFANRAARRFVTGSEDGVLEGRSLLALVHPDDRDDGRRLLAEASSTGRPLSWTSVKVLVDDGRTLDMTAQIAPIEFRGTPALVVAARDESEPRLARREREESERRYQTLAETVPIAISRLDAEGRCIYLNDGWSRLVGLAPAETLGAKWTDLVEDRFRPAAERIWERMRREGRAQRGEYRFTRRDGAEVVVIAQAVPERDASGEVRGWVTTLTDMTDLKHAQRALAASEERLRTALEAANVASWETDNAPNDEVRWSPNAGRVLGLPDDQVPRARAAFWALVPEQAVGELRRQSRGALNASEVLELEMCVRAGTNAERWLSIRGRAFAAQDDAPPRLAGIVADVTARHRLTEEREALLAKLQEAQRLESLGLLAGGVAHDFNSLLVGILGNAELALDAAPAEGPLRARLEELRAAGLRAAELAQQILAYSGRGPLAAAPVDLGELAAETVALLRPGLPPGARVRVDVSPDAIVEGDATQLRQVLLNLVRNAAEALGADGGDVTVSVARDPLGDHVNVRVLDTGCGMDAPTRARIFDPFFTTRATGRGLGLAVVHGIVRAHAGELAVDSAPGRGTRMELRLPASRSRRVDPDPARPGSIASAPAGVVLVVDDERAVRDVSRLALEAAGYSVRCAGEAGEAAACARAEGSRLGVVVLDLSLGRGSSESVLRALRAVAPSVPVVITSGYGEEEALERLAGHGVAAFLQKPFTPAQLCMRVAEVLARAR